MSVKKRKHQLSVDLGEDVSALLDILVSRGNGKSAIIRKAVKLVYMYDLLPKFDMLEKQFTDGPPAKTPRGPAKMIPEERALIAQWRKEFDYDGRVHMAAYLRVIRKAVKDGCTYTELGAVLGVAKEDSFIASILSKDGFVPLTTIFAEKCIATLLPLADAQSRDDAQRARLHLDGVVRPRALSQLRELVSKDLLAQVYDSIMAAKTEDEIITIMQSVIEVREDELMDRLGKEIS